MLAPLIQDRLDGKLDANGEKHKDLIQWLIDAAPPVEKTIPQLAERVMALNVASIHTTTMVHPCCLPSPASLKIYMLTVTGIDIHGCLVQPSR